MSDTHDVFRVQNYYPLFARARIFALPASEIHALSAETTDPRFDERKRGESVGAAKSVETKCFPWNGRIASEIRRIAEIAYFPEYSPAASASISGSRRKAKVAGMEQWANSG